MLLCEGLRIWAKGYGLLKVKSLMIETNYLQINDFYPAKKFIQCLANFLLVFFTLVF